MTIGSLLFVLSATQANAQTFAVRSLGMQKCENLIADLQSTDRRGSALLYSQWLAGYLTSKNSTLKVLDAFPIRDPLDEWVRFVALVCAGNADKRLVEVADASINILEKYRIYKDEETVTINRDDAAPLIVYRSFLREAQEILKSEGYRVAPDGIFGDMTERAFRQYKVDKNVPGPAMPDAFFLLSAVGQ